MSQPPHDCRDCAQCACGIDTDPSSCCGPAITTIHRIGGAPVTADASNRDKLSSINFGGDFGISHMAMDKSPKFQAEN
jgi:hypothetical protein